MYKVASDKAQRSARRIHLRDIAHGHQEFSTTLESQKAHLISRMKIIEAEIGALPKCRRRDALGQEKFQLQQEISELNKQIKEQSKAARGLSQYFIDVAREQLDPFKFKLLMAEASNRAQKAGAMVDE